MSPGDVSAMPADPRQLAAAFFDQFVHAFASFDGELVARRYHAPYLALHADGSMDLHERPQDTARYFQAILDGYHARGARSCTYDSLEVVPLGQAHLLATVTWTLLDATGAELDRWRESYTLAVQAGHCRITTSIDH